MRKSQSNFTSQAELPLGKDRPILDFLLPVRIENWRQEGLFTRTRHSVGQKVRFVMYLRARAFDFSAKNWIELHNDNSTASRQEVMCDKKIQAMRMFNVVRDPFMREVMQRMIVSEKLLGARYIAQKLQIRWPQFVIDFNAALDDVMDAADLQRQ